MQEDPSKLSPADAQQQSATQLSLLLDAAQAIISEEFKRSERLDAKSRNQITVVGSFFAVVQAIVVGLLNGALKPTGSSASDFVPWLAVTGGAAAIAMIVALAVSYRAWKLRDDPALGIDTISNYLDAARDGNPAVGVHLVNGLVQIARGRRSANTSRADALENAAIACGVALALTGVELILAFVAIGVQ